MKIAAPQIPFSLAVLGLVAVGVALYVAKKGGVGAAASSFGGAVVNSAVDVVKGAGAAIIDALPDDLTVRDPRVARWIIDNVGYWEALRWCSPAALSGATGLEVGDGIAPTGAIAARYANYATYDETNRLLGRYPAPTPAAPVIDVMNPTTWGLGA